MENDSSTDPPTKYNFDIYVINLDKDHDRMKSFENRMKPYPFTRICACYGKELDLSHIENVYTLSKYFTPKSVIGCSLSHKMAMEAFVLSDSSNQIALICEDDAVPMRPATLMDEIAECIQHAPEDWDVIKLDYFPGYYGSSSKSKSKTESYTSFPSLLLTAYLVRKSAAEKMRQYKVFHYPDWDMNFYDLRIYHSPAILFHQLWDEPYSNNQLRRSMNPLYYLFPYKIFTFKLFRIGSYEFTFHDFFLIVAILFVGFYVLVLLLLSHFLNLWLKTYT